MDPQLLAVLKEQPVQLAVFGGHAPAVPLGPPPRAAPGDRAEPAAKAAGIVELRQCLERQQERILGNVLCGGAAARALFGDRHDGSAEAAHELIERIEIAEERPQHQLLVCLFRKKTAACFHVRSLPRLWALVSVPPCSR